MGKNILMKQQEVKLIVKQMAEDKNESKKQTGSSW